MSVQQKLTALAAECGLTWPDIADMGITQFALLLRHVRGKIQRDLK